MKKNKIWKVLAIVNILGATFTGGMMIGGNTSDGLRTYLITAIGIVILSFGQYYSVDENMSDEEFEREFCKAVKRNWKISRQEQCKMDEMD